MDPLLPDEFPFSRRRVATPRGGAAKRVENVAPEAAAPTPAPELITAPAEVIAPPIAAAPATPETPATPAAPVAEIPRTPWQTIAPPETEAVAVATKPTAPVTTSQSARAATSRASVAPAFTKPIAASVTTSAPPVAPAIPAASSYKGPERRRSPRQSMRAKAIFRGDLNPAAAGPVQILNVSLCGVRLWSAKPLKAGERGNVKMEIGPVKWSSRIKVVACTPQDEEGFAIGCEFAANEVARRVA